MLITAILAQSSRKAQAPIAQATGDAPPTPEVKIATPRNWNLSSDEETALLNLIQQTYKLIALKKGYESDPVEKTTIRLSLQAGEEVEARAFSSNFLAPQQLAAGAIKRELTTRLSNVSYSRLADGIILEVEITSFKVRVGKTTNCKKHRGCQQTNIVIIPLEVKITRKKMEQENG